MRFIADIALTRFAVEQGSVEAIEACQRRHRPGAWLNAAAALGLALGVVEPQPRPALSTTQGHVLTRFRLAGYPQFGRLARQFQGASEVTPAEALGLYERNWRHIEQDALAPHERALIQQLVASRGGGRLLV